MKLISVNVALPKEVVWKGKTVKTGIFKKPVKGRVGVQKLNLEGDQQADLSVHGGPEKAIYVYPFEHYDYWRKELPGVELPAGAFGENFTVEGLIEESVNIGDQFKIGSAAFMVTQPRLPCYKLGVKFGRDDMVKRFMKSHLTGFYFSVLEEGNVGAGDSIELIYRDPCNISVADITRLYVSKNRDKELMRRATQIKALPTGWRDYFLQQI